MSSSLEGGGVRKTVNIVDLLKLFSYKIAENWELYSRDWNGNVVCENEETRKDHDAKKKRNIENQNFKKKGSFTEEDY